MLPSGLEVKWCGLCGKWGDHYSAGNPNGENEKEEEAGDGDGHVAIADNANLDVDDLPPAGAFARLRAAGLIRRWRQLSHTSQRGLKAIDET